MSDEGHEVAGAAGELLIDLARRFAEAWADGDERAALRWCDLALRLRGADTFVDHEAQ